MSDAAFASALAATLLPGGALANGVVAPPAHEVIGTAELAAWVRAQASAAAVAAIRRTDGGAAGFAAAGADRRTEILQAVEARDPAALQALVAGLHLLYYQHPAVVAAFGWRAAPPQPEGHVIPGTDPAHFEDVARGGPIWRDPGP